VGLVDVSTSPLRSTATHRLAEAQDTALSGRLDEKVLQAPPPPVGLVEVRRLPA
jgi:hypothetical protein